MKTYCEDFQGKVVVITGGGRGIGAAIGREFAKEGAKVVLLATTESQVSKVAQEIREQGGEAIGAVCNVADYQSVEQAFSLANNTFGGVDIVFVNAGIDPCREPVGADNMEDWKRSIEVNLMGAYYTARAAIPYLKQRGGGKIIGIGSGLGRHAGPGHSSYGAAKAGLSILLKVLAAELKGDHISCNEIIPGPVASEINREYLEGKRTANFFEGEWLKPPEDVVPLALFVASLPNDGPSAQLFSIARREI